MLLDLHDLALLSICSPGFGIRVHRDVRRFPPTLRRSVF
jgi:hypothetical protein